MKRYTPQIVAQRMGKLQQKIVQIVRVLLFGIRSDYRPSLQKLYSRGAVYSYHGIDSRGQATIALFPYRTPAITHSIHELKYYNQRIYAETYGSMVAEYLVELLAEYALMYNIHQPLLCYVPSHRSRQRMRGFEPNALVLEHALQQGLAPWVAYSPTLLSKHRNTPQQSRSHSRAQRLGNPRGAFRASSPPAISRQDVILFDDVYTTGATLDECTRLLHQAGARRIIRLTLAH